MFKQYSMCMLIASACDSPSCVSSSSPAQLSACEFFPLLRGVSVSLRPCFCVSLNQCLNRVGPQCSILCLDFKELDIGASIEVIRTEEVFPVLDGGYFL